MKMRGNKGKGRGEERRGEGKTGLGGVEVRGENRRGEGKGVAFIHFLFYNLTTMGSHRQVQGGVRAPDGF